MLDKLIIYGVWLALLTPLVFLSLGAVPLTASKTIFFELLTAILLLAVSWQAFKKRTKTYLTPISIGLGVFLLVQFLAAILGVDLQHSFWGSLERFDGLWLWLHLGAWFLIIHTILDTQQKWLAGWRVIFLSGVAAALIGAGQAFGLLRLLTNDDTILGTFGNPSYLGIFLAFSFFAGLIVLLGTRVSTRWMMIQIGSGLGLIVAGVLLSQSRSSLIGLVAGIVVFALLRWLHKSTRQPSAPLWRLVLGSLIAGTLLSIVLTTALSLPSSALQRIPEISSSDPTSRSRLLVWQAGIKAWQTRPLLGWGPANVEPAINQEVRPGVFSYDQGWFDKTHSEPVDLLVESGAAGVLAYLLLIIASAVSILRLSSRYPQLAPALAGALAVFFVAQLGLFRTPSTLIAFVFLLGHVNFLAYGTSRREINIGRLAVVLLIGFSSLSLALNARLASGLLSFERALAMHQRREPADRQAVKLSYQEALNKAQGYSRDILSRLVQEETGSVSSEQPQSFELMELARLKLKEAQDLHPLDIRAKFLYAKVLIALANERKDYLDRAVEALNEAKKLSPNRPEIHYELAMAALKKEDFDMASSILESVEKNSPGIGSTARMLAGYYFLQQDFDQAAWWAREAIRRGYDYRSKGDLALFASIFSKSGDKDNTLEMFTKLTELYPQEARYWEGLAGSYAQLGRYQEAIEAAQNVIKLDSSRTQEASRFIEQLRSLTDN